MEFGVSDESEREYQATFEIHELSVFRAATLEEAYSRKLNQQEPHYLHEVWLNLRPGYRKVLFGDLDVMEQTAALLRTFGAATPDAAELIESQHAPHQDPATIIMERRKLGELATNLARDISSGLAMCAQIDGDKVADDFAAFLADPA